VNKKEEFKEFASKNKYLFDKVKNKETSWQELYETFDIYGSDSNVWDKYKTKEKDNTKVTESVKNVLSNLKNIDMDKLEDNISSLQKALGFLEEIVSTKTEKKEEKRTTKRKSTEIERFFDD